MLSLTSRAAIRGDLTLARDGGTATFPIDESHLQSWADGTGAGQANAAYVDDFTIAASSNLDIDLAGSLTDVFGAAVVFTAVKEILVIAAPANANTIVIGNGSNPFVGPFGSGAHTQAVKPGGRFSAVDPSAAGWAVVAATGDILRLANSGSGSTVSGTIVIIGER